MQKKRKKVYFFDWRHQLCMNIKIADNNVYRKKQNKTGELMYKVDSLNT